jgi:hypothetical protein
MKLIQKQMQRRPWLSILLDYKASFLLVFAAIVAVFVLLPILSSIGSLYQYYFNLKTGFVPAVQVRLKGEEAQGEARVLREALEKRFHPAKSLVGSQIEFPAARLRSGFDLSMEQPLTVVGLDFTGDRTVKVRQGTTAGTCKLEQLQEFGSWVLDLSACGKFEEGSAFLGEGKEEIPVDILGQGDLLQAYFDTDAHPEAAQGFYLFLESLIDRFFRLEDTGLLFDRFVDYSRQEGVDFSVYKKRGILSYARLIFDRSEYGVPALLSRKLMKTISSYEIASDITLEPGNGREPIELAVLDAFAFEAEAHFPSNLVLVSLERFETNFAGPGSQWLVNLYFDGAGPLAEVRDFVQERFPGAEVVLRTEAIPSLNFQLKTLEAGKIGMFSVLYLILLLILLVNMQKFYSIFNDQFFLLKIYGFNAPLFTWCALALGVAGALVAYLVLRGFYAMNNAALEFYYYPPIHLPANEYLLLAGIGLAILLLGLLVEKFYNLKRISA